MANEEDILNANRLSSLTYMVAACLNFSIENLNRQLRLCNLQLVGRDKMLFNRIKTQIEQLQSNLNILEDLAFGVMKDEDARLAYEDATHIYWALFMTLVDRGGTDNLCDLRFKALIDIIGKYESILHLPGLDTAYHCAFAQVSKAIQEGKYSKEDFKNLLKVHENGTEETKG
jgi:hypothetical protein